MNTDVNKCCCGGECSCSPKETKKSLLIDFLYLDLETCERCKNTDKTLYEAIHEVSKILESAGYRIVLNKVNITSADQAIKYEFVSSPTIRLNHHDIALELKESNCKECGDICGDDVDCRVWTYAGVEYTDPPKAMIINAILKEVYSGEKPNTPNQKYQLPLNLKRFFEGASK